MQSQLWLWWMYLTLASRHTVHVAFLTTATWSCRGNFTTSYWMSERLSGSYIPSCACVGVGRKSEAVILQVIHWKIGLQRHSARYALAVYLFPILLWVRAWSRHVARTYNLLFRADLRTFFGDRGGLGTRLLSGMVAINSSSLIHVVVIAM